MAKVLFIDSNGNNVVKGMEHIPRVGDEIVIFNSRHTVKKVLWNPEGMFKELEPVKADVLITVVGV